MAKADADRARRLAGHKPLFRRLLERLRPHREEPGSDPEHSGPHQKTRQAAAGLAPLSGWVPSDGANVA
jgi:hypothetical protein